MHWRFSVLALLGLLGVACARSTTSSSCSAGASCSGEGTTCSPAPIGSGWSHALMCQGGKWSEIEIAPLPTPVTAATPSASTPGQPPAPPLPVTAEPSSAPKDGSVCTVSTPWGTIAADPDGGRVNVDGPAGTRRFVVSQTPHNGTVMLIFRSYGAGDRKPKSETLTPGTSIVARIVAYGEHEQHLFLDGDYQPAKAQMPPSGFVCGAASPVTP